MICKESWRDIIGYEGLYQISDYGRVRSISRDIIRKQQYDKDGYLRVGLSKNNKMSIFYVHRLVLINFIGLNKERKFCNHIDGIKDNNFIMNLEWVTPSENLKHSFRIGLTSHKGEKHNLSKLTEKQVFEIYNLFKNGKSTKYLSVKYSVSNKTIYDIVSGKKWKHLNLKKLTYKGKLTKEEVTEIFFSKDKHKVIAKRYNISTPQVDRIKNGTTQSKITMGLKC